MFKRGNMGIKIVSNDEIKKEIAGCSDEELDKRIEGIESTIKDGFPIVDVTKDEGIHRDPKQVLEWLKEEKEKRLRSK
jgi:hypothetical protein